LPGEQEVVRLKIGGKIRALRLTSELTQEELANRARLTKGFISQLENDQTSISLDSLADILDALGVSLSEFFTDSAEAKVVFRPVERVAVEGKGAGKFELLIPGSTNNLMDPIYIELQPGEKLKSQEPHSGEQFGYVLKGTATLKINKKVFKVSRKHCFYFKSDRPHQIVNNSDRVVTLLWVTSPPQM
jgi:transcriptional regulator with XRE-family HTH domain